MGYQNKGFPVLLYMRNNIFNQPGARDFIEAVSWFIQNKTGSITGYCQCRQQAVSLTA